MSIKIFRLFFASLFLISLIGCAATLRKEDILLEAQRIKAAARVPASETPAQEPATAPTTAATTTITLPEPIPLALPLPPPAQEILFKEEKLTYKAKYLGVAIGDFILLNKGKVLLNGKPAYCFEIDVKTLPFFALLFRTKDRYVSYMDPEKFVVLRHEEYIKEGTFLESVVDFDHTNHLAYYKNFTSKEEKKVVIPEKVLDVVSGGYYLRMIPWTVGDTQEVALYADELIYNFIGLIHSSATLSVPGTGSQQATLFKPYVFLNGKQITKISAEVYFSMADEKLPLRAILKTPLGNVLVVLIETP